MTSNAAAPPTWPELLTALIGGTDLTRDEALWAMTEIMTGEAPAICLAGFLVALRAKGESVTELRALADVMVAQARRITVPGETLDIVGTGGDRSHTVNISTMSAIVIAGAGRTVVKHGNRAASSSSGSADVVEALGVDLSLPPERVEEIAAEAGITFCFANQFHPAMRYAAEVRGGLKVATAFNLLGPLTNPARPTYAAIGVADARMAPIMAGVFAERGQAAAVFRGHDGLDELTTVDASSLWWVRDGKVSEHTLTPEDVGLVRVAPEALRGGEPAHNAAVVRALLAGRKDPVRDAVLLNAGTALAVAAGTAGHDTEAIVAAVSAGMVEAAESIDSGAASAVLDRWVAATRR